MLRFLTAGESHGPGLAVIIEGLPAGLPLAAEDVDVELARRQQGYGRGGRMKIETDTVTFVSGVRLGHTTGAPLAMHLANRDWVNWRAAMAPEPRDPADEEREAQLARRRVTRLRPGHADFPGALKYGHEDVRDVLERASARETAMRVAAGAVARLLLRELDVDVTSHVLAIGGIQADPQAPGRAGDVAALREAVAASPVRCADPSAAARMVEAIDAARQAGTSLGGVIEVQSTPLPIGLGSCVHWDRRLDGRLAQAVMSIQAIKGVEIGLGFAGAARPGHQAHDPFEPGFRRASNHAGGLEGGMSNGQPLVLRAAMKPIATMPRGLPSIDLATGEPASAHFERADVCAVPAAGVIAEAMVAWVLAEAALEKYGGDSLAEFAAHYRASRALQAEQLQRGGRTDGG